jgi:hypothetical protein
MGMKAVEPVREFGVAQALSKGTCPICALLREFQNDLIDTLAPCAAEYLCNFHAWAIAHATPATSVVRIFSRLLESGGANDWTRCGICEQVLKEEELRVHEVAKELGSRATLAQWLLRHGSICLNHATKLRAFVPDHLQEVVSQIVQRNLSEMKRDLDLYRKQIEHGTKAGGGVLGKIAEFLVSQRGITH